MGADAFAAPVRLVDRRRDFLEAELDVLDALVGRGRATGDHQLDPIGPRLALQANCAPDSVNSIDLHAETGGVSA